MTFDSEYFNLGYLDTLSYKDTFVHRLDPRVKLFVSFIFILFVVSFPKYELSGLMPFFIYPVFLLTAGDIPLKAIVKKVLFVSPFAIFIGIFNPLIDTNVIIKLFGVPVTGGWVSFFSIIVKFILTVSTALLLIAVTSFPGICEALERLKLPKIFVVQLLFLYRYLFVLFEETLRMVRAREARSFGKKGKEMKTFIRLVSVLLIKSVERAERIYQAMLSRGFRGEIKVLKIHSLRLQDVLFAIFSVIIFYAFRNFDIVSLIGETLRSFFR
ncbi:MAG: cobalt ECF transporter T component CbiQ [Nitrospirae bacterium RBG_13_39_12]|nr:MAG: cobalt ECF transporter T component CbiQ [Nitrospirae bacterium RBG_13_39_12]